VFEESCVHRVEMSADADSLRAILIADFASPYLTSEADYMRALALPPEGELAQQVRRRYQVAHHRLRSHKIEL
jgi:hypothetical protein